MKKLTGTSRQVAWAEEIRTHALPRAELGARRITDPALRAIALDITRWMTTIPTAAWWIEQRHHYWPAFIVDLAERQQQLNELETA